MRKSFSRFDDSVWVYEISVFSFTRGWLITCVGSTAASEIGLLLTLSCQL